MTPLLTYRVRYDVVLSILNTIYAIFLGLLFTLFFSIANNVGQVSITVNLTSANWLAVTLFSSYLVFDWLTTNITVLLKGGTHHLLLMALILLISYLGALVVLAFQPGMTLYIMFSLYACIVPLWDFIVPHLVLSEGKRKLAPVLIYMVGLSRLVVGWSLLCFTLLHAWLRLPHSGDIIEGTMQIGLSLVVLLKAVRYLIYIHYGGSRLSTNAI